MGRSFANCATASSSSTCRIRSSLATLALGVTSRRIPWCNFFARTWPGYQLLSNACRATSTSSRSIPSALRLRSKWSAKSVLSTSGCLSGNNFVCRSKLSGNCIGVRSGHNSLITIEPVQEVSPPLLVQLAKYVVK